MIHVPEMPLFAYKHECFQEFSDEISLVLWSWGCNWKCPWCSVKNMVSDKKCIIPEKYTKLIANPTEIETAVVFLGGEPTIHEEALCYGCAMAQDGGLKTKLFTNGSNPEVIRDLVNRGLLNSLSIDMKGIGFDLEPALSAAGGITTEIRTTVHPLLRESELVKIESEIIEDLRMKYDFKFIKQRYQDL